MKGFFHVGYLPDGCFQERPQAVITSLRAKNRSYLLVSYLKDVRGLCFFRFIYIDMLYRYCDPLIDTVICLPSLMKMKCDRLLECCAKYLVAERLRQQPRRRPAPVLAVVVVVADLERSLTPKILIPHRTVPTWVEQGTGWIICFEAIHWPIWASRVSSLF